MMQMNVTEAEKMMQDSDALARVFSFIRIHLRDHVVGVMEEQPLYTAASVMGALGGILNLWVGLSFFTAIEILDCLISSLLWRHRKGEDKANTE